MNRLQLYLLAHAPGAVRRQALVQLFAASAAAFQAEMPGLRGLTREQCLLAYAGCTSEWAGEAVGRGDDLPALEARLYGNACRLGHITARLFPVRNVDGVMTLARFLYDILDIDLQGTAAGEITISACYFSRFYSPEICRLMSAMDRGLFAGLAGGGELTFSRRITEGDACCRARFAPREQPR